MASDNRRMNINKRNGIRRTGIGYYGIFKALDIRTGMS